MRIAYVVNTPRFFLSHWEPIALAAREAGFEVHVICPPGADVREIRSRGWSTHLFAVHRSGGAPIRELRSIRELKRIYASIRPDIVHHFTAKPVLYGAIAARLAGVPAVVSTITGLGFAFADGSLRARVTRTIIIALYRFALRHRNQTILFENRDDLNLFSELGIVGGSETAVVPGAGVDCEQFSPGQERSDVPLVVLPGRLLWTKGVGVFVEAANMLHRRGVSARFVVVGERDPGNPACVSEKWLLQHSSEVEFWGFCRDMPQVFRDATLVCLPSVREGLPKVLLEAAASGRAVVTTDVPGCRQAVQHDVSGLVVPPGNALATAKAVQRLLENGALRRSMGEAGRRRALEQFAVHRVTDAVLKVYSSLLASAVHWDRTDSASVLCTSMSATPVSPAP